MAFTKSITLGKGIYKSVDASKILGDNEILESNVIETENDKNASIVIEPPVDPQALKVLRNCSVYHKLCLEAKAEDVVLSGWKAVSTDDKASETNKEQLESIFNNHNNLMALYFTILDYVTYPHAAYEIVNNDKGEFRGFKYIRSTTIKMRPDGESAVQEISGEKKYFRVFNKLNKHRKDYLDEDKGDWSQNTPEERRATDIIWLNGLGPDSDHYHEPSYIAATHTIINEDFIRQYNNNSLVNNSVPNWLITFTGNFEAGERDEKGLTKFEKNLQTNIAELPNQSGTAIVFTLPAEEDGKIEVTAVKLSDEVQESSFEKAKSTNMVEILAAHKVPPGRLGIAIDGALGGAVDIERNKNYNKRVIQPLQSMLDTILNEYIIKGLMEIEDWKHEFKEMDIRNLEAEWTIAKEGVNLGAMKPVEARINVLTDLFNLDNNPDGKDIVLYFPELDQFYYNGQQLGFTPEQTPEVPEEILKSLKDFQKQCLEAYQDESILKSGDNSGRADNFIKWLKDRINS